MVQSNIDVLLDGECPVRDLRMKTYKFITPLCQRGPTNFVIQNAMVRVVGVSANESEGRMSQGV